MNNEHFPSVFYRLVARAVSWSRTRLLVAILLMSSFWCTPVLSAENNDPDPSVYLVLQDKITIRGTITDESGDPIPGVSVIEKNTTNGTISNENGQYEINVSPDATMLVFQFVGKKTLEIAISGRSQINVVMREAAIGLDEVVVTALGIKKSQKSIGYATQEVEGQSMTLAQEPNIIDNLTGRVAGLTVYNSTDFFATSGIRLRGDRPLFVIDGIPSEGSDLWEVNADDIESINVLK